MINYVREVMSYRRFVAAQYHVTQVANIKKLSELRR